MQQTWRVGDAITHRSVMEHMPVGTITSDPNGTRFRKIRNGNWEDLRNGGRWRTNDFALRSSPLTIAELPRGTTEVSVVQETAEQVKWAFRTGALNAAQQHGVANNVVERVLTDMGIGANDMKVTLGRGVHVGDNGSMGTLPEGSVIYTGTPAQPGTFAAFVRKGGQWVHILGEQNWMNGVMTIESVGGDRTRPDWLDREGTEEDAEEIAAFKARAWRLGWNLKQSSGWCSTYEDIMHGLGVSVDDLNNVRHGGVGVGERIDFHIAAGLPQGTLLWWQHTEHPERWMIFRRHNGAVNVPRTTQVARSEHEVSGDNYKRRMTVLALGNEDGTVNWTLPTEPEGLVTRLPAGTVLAFIDGEEYVKCANNTFALARDFRYASQVVSRQGNYNIDAFGRVPNWHLMRFLP